jgi:catechol 2,3-dioxygenase-like lactoylglutathione lyase family enzyme
MFKKFGKIIITVRDYDEALDFYVGKLGFTKLADKELVPGVRWVSVAPSPNSETIVVFEKATTAADKERLGKQFKTMTLDLVTNDLDETYKKLIANGVEFVEKPTMAPWGKQAVIRDLYGNLFDIVEE